MRSKRMRNLLVGGIFGLMGISLPLAQVRATTQATFYVSPTGSGTSCTLSSPCSLLTGQAQVEAINQNMTGDIIVNLLDGTYGLTSTFQLAENATTHDSGTNGYNVTYQAYTGATPVLSGGTSLSGWTQVDPTLNIWKAQVPGAPTNGILQMYVNGIRAVVARGEDNPSGFSPVTQYMTLDAFNVHNGSTSTMVNDTDPGITYSGSWTYGPNRGTGDYDNDIHYTTQKAASAQYSFTGTGIDVLAETYSAHSSAVQVYIDGTLDQTVSEVTSTRLGQQTIYSNTGLANGAHTIEIVHYPPADITVSNSNYNMSTWGNPSQIRLVTNYLFVDSMCQIDSISGNNISMQEPGWALRHAAMGSIGWVENAYELLKTPGQFYYNVSDGYMYYIPRSYENLSTATVIVPLVEKLVSGVGDSGTPLHNVKLIGLTFEYGTWLSPESNLGFGGGQGDFYYNTNNLNNTNGDVWNIFMKTAGTVQFNNAQNVVIQGNLFTHLGATALIFENASQNNTIIGNNFFDISAGGILVGDVNDYANSTSSTQSINNTVQDNYLTTTGVQYVQTIPIMGGYNNNLQILHNEIDNTPYTGISLGWGWGYETTTPYSGTNSISYNRITNVMQTLTDGGGIYTLSYQPSSTISNNYIANDLSNYGAIYLDNGTNNYTVTNNVVANYVPAWLFVQNGSPVATNNTVTNNYTENSSTAGNPTANNNTLSSTTAITSGSWPTAATAIKDVSGLEYGYQSLKTAVGVMVDDSDPGITYTGSWTNGSGRRNDYGNAAHYTSTSGDYVQYSFEGTGIDVLGELAVGHTTSANVYIDNVFQQSIAESATYRTYQQTVYSISGLTSGPHTIKIVNNSSGFLLLDAFRVYGRPVYYKIKNHTDGLVLNGGGNSNGYQVTEWADLGNTNQQWEIVDLGNGYVKIKNHTDGLVLNGGGNSNGYGVTEWSDVTSTNLQWQIISLGNGYFKIENHTDGKVLNGGGNTNGYNVTEWSDVMSTNLEWQILAN